MTDVVDLWLISTELPDAVLAELEPLLDADERARADLLLAPARRRRFVAAHGAARLIIGRRLGAPPEALRWRHGPNGKPDLTGSWANAQVSLSHSATVSALALTADRVVGVDIQDCPAGLDATRMAARFYPAAEAQFVAAARDPAAARDRYIRLWARKEACVKVAGGRLLPGLRLATHDGSAGDGPVDDGPVGDGPVGDGSAGGGSAENGCAEGKSQIIVCDTEDMLPGPCLVRDIPVHQGCHAAIAVAGTQPFRVTRHWWPGDQPGR